MTPQRPAPRPGALARWRALARGLHGLHAALAPLLALGLTSYAALHGVAGASSSLADLNIEAPPLAQLPEAAPAPRSPALTRRVVLFIIDGLSSCRSHALPTLEELRRRGVSAVAASHAPTLSRPNYVSILTGVPPAYSGVRSNDYPWQVPLDSLLHRVQATGRRTAFATDAAPGFGSMFAAQLSEGGAAPWSGGLARAGLLALDRRYPLVVLIPGAVDDAGHRAGGASPRYRDAALAVDRQLRDLLVELDLSKDTIVVAADHGHTDRGGHGGQEPEVVQVPLVMAGAGIRRGAQLPGARLIDLAPTLAVLLGAATPRQAMGRTLIEALELPPPRAEALRREDERRVASLRRFLHEHPAPLARPLLDRLFAAFALTVLGLFLASLGRAARVVAWDARVVAATLAEVGGAAVILFLCSGAQLSISALPNRTAGTQTVATAATLTAGWHVALSWWALRRRHGVQRMTAACGLALFGLALTRWLEGVAVAIAGEPPWLTLPPLPMLIALPMVRMTMATCALSSGLVVAIELVVFAARSSHRIDAPAPTAAASR